VFLKTKIALTKFCVELFTPVDNFHRGGCVVSLWAVPRHALKEQGLRQRASLAGLSAGCFRV